MKIYRCEGRMMKKKAKKEIYKPLAPDTEPECKACVSTNKDDIKIPLPLMPSLQSSCQGALMAVMANHSSPLDRDFWGRVLTNHFSYIS